MNTDLNVIKREQFNPKCVKHRKSLYKFIETGKWELHFKANKDCTNLPYQLMVETLMFFKQDDDNLDTVAAVGKLI